MIYYFCTECYAKLTKKENPFSPVVRIKQQFGGYRVDEDIKTVVELFRRSVVKYKSEICVGYRPVLSEHTETDDSGKITKKATLGDYVWYSYCEIDESVESLAQGFLRLGFQPFSMIVIFAETRLEWFLILNACFRINIAVSTLYATLGEEGIVFGINETEVKTVITSQDLFPKLKNVLKQTPSVQSIIIMDDVPTLPGIPDTIEVIKLSKIEELGKSSIKNKNLLPITPPRPTDLAVIMYPSGSTGYPKGVLITHKNLLAVVFGACDAYHRHKTDVYIAYLPLAHIFEMIMELFFFTCGIPIGFSSVHTLMNTSTGLEPGCEGDINVLRPTVLPTVPLILERIRKVMMDVYDSDLDLWQSFKKELFLYIVKYKYFWMEKGFDTPLINKFLINGIRKKFGGLVRLVCCGGAPLSAETSMFICGSLNMHAVAVGYGLTETTGACILMSDMYDYGLGTIGAPAEGVFVKLIEWRNGGYSPVDQPNPRGELVIGGDCVTEGYYKREELTVENFEEDCGIWWCKTGDVGELLPNGTFKIIDRKKHLVKLQHGEYVSLGKIEGILKTSPLVENICVIGNGLHNYVIAIVIPNKGNIRALAACFGKRSYRWEQMCKDRVVLDIVTKQIKQHAKEAGLSNVEIPTKYHLCPNEWTVENKLLTPTLKIRRKLIETVYEDVIEQMYPSKGDTISHKSKSKSTKS